MSKTSEDKVNKTLSFQFFFAKAIEKIAEKKGVTMSALIETAVIQQLPEILDYKTRISRRVV